MREFVCSLSVSLSPSLSLISLVLRVVVLGLLVCASCRVYLLFGSWAGLVHICPAKIDLSETLDIRRMAPRVYFSVPRRVCGDTPSPLPSFLALGPDGAAELIVESRREVAVCLHTENH